jgi:endonuclease/exonuclease/phosphatase family metal-dependent hydrolase
MVCALLVLVGVCLCWFVVNRGTSSWTAVKVRSVAGDSAAATTFAGRLRIATYNIAHGRGTAPSNWQRGEMDALRTRLARIADHLRAEDLDIVVLNEVDFDSAWTGHMDQARYIAERAGFVYLAEQRNYDMAFPLVSLRWGNAVLSRHPISDARRIRLPGFSAFETALAGCKNGMLCTITLGQGRRIVLLGVHLEHRAEATRLQAAERMEEVRRACTDPVIVAGDLNSTRVGFPRATYAGDRQTALSYLLDSGAYRTLPTDDPRPEELTFSVTQPSSVIDWILVPADWTIVSKSVEDWALSDHRPVVMEVRADDWPTGAGPNGDVQGQ